MSGNRTAKMIPAYYQNSQSPIMFFSGFFQSPQENYYESEEVEIDIVRGGEEVSIVVNDISNGYRLNSENLYTNKGFKAPVHKEAVPINSYDLMKRMPGANPFEAPQFRAAVIVKLFAGMRKIEPKIRRAIEVQAAQIMQTGVLTLIDSNGAALYQLDYKPKASHFPTAGVSWATATGAQMLADIEALGEVVRTDGLGDPDQIIMGKTAFNTFSRNSTIQALFDNRNIHAGSISGLEMRGNGGTYRGTIDIGHYKYEIWTYSGRYEHPQTKVSTEYMAPGKVIVRDSKARLDATFGGIPNIGKLLGAQPTRLLPELPGRFPNSSRGIDLFTNAWLTEDGETLYGGIGARPLLVPTAIDSFGCLTTQL